MFSFVDNVDQSIQNWNYNKHVNTTNMFWNSGKVEYLNEINENINKARFKPDKKYNRYTRVTNY